MKVRLEATPAELQKRGGLLFLRLAKAVAEYAPDLSARLEAAAEDEHAAPEMRHLFQREGLQRIRALYSRTLDSMLSEIGAALDERVLEMGGGDLEKGAATWDMLVKHVNSGPYIGPHGGKWADPQHTVHWDPAVHGRVLVHSHGGEVPEGVKWKAGVPGPGYHSTVNYKGSNYTIKFGHEGGKFAGTVQMPNGDTHKVTSPNHAATTIVLHSRGLDPKLDSTAVKELGIAYPAKKLFAFDYVTAQHTVPPPIPDAAPQPKQLGIRGHSAPLYMAAGSGAPQKQTAHYALVDAHDLVPSHQPQSGFLAHPSYPAGVQERRYDRDKAEQLKVHGVAQQLNPEILFTPSVDAIQGPPVVTDDGVVLGGNGRTMALQLHYAAGDAKAEATRAFLSEHAAAYGFTASDVAKVKNPVVVRVVDTPKDTKTLATLVRRYNESSSQGMDAKAAAVGEARRMDTESMGLLGATMPDDATLSEYLGTPASRPFVQSLRTAGILNQRNASVMLGSDGLLNDDGKQMVGRVLTAALIPDANLLEDVGGQLRGTLARSAPYVLAGAAESEPEWDLRPAIQAAARDVVRARATGAVTVDEYLNQGSLFGDKPATVGVPLGKEMLQLLWAQGDKPLVFSRAMRTYLNAARTNPRGQADMFATEKQTPAEVLQGLVSRVSKADVSALTDEERSDWLALAGAYLEKGVATAGPFIGPRGGKWADAAHTIAWEPHHAAAPHGVPWGEHTTADKLPGGIKAAIGHLHPSKYPPPAIPLKDVHVHLNGDVNSHSVLTWRDTKGRQQDAYTEAFLARNAAHKWERVKKLEPVYERSVEAFKGAMSNGATEKERDTGAVMLIIALTGLRPGASGHLEATGHRGISTLGPDNVKVEGNTVHLDFVGKSGKRNQSSATDPALARYVKGRLKARGGEELLWTADHGDLAGQLERAGIGDFKPKDFRTVVACRAAATALAHAEEPPPPLPEKESAAKKLVKERVNAASAQVAALIQNTPAMARKSYISPAIIEAWLASVGGSKDLLKSVKAQQLMDAAMRITLPGHDQEVHPVDEDDDDLEMDPLPMGLRDDAGA